MVIECRNVKELRELQLHLNSTDINYRCCFNPTLDPVSGIIPPEREAYAYIGFRDSYEIDQLIDILLRFKEENRRYFGTW